MQRQKKKGTRKEVWDGQAKCTGGGLTKSDLTLNKKGKIVSVKKQAHGAGLVDLLKKWSKKSKLNITQQQRLREKQAKEMTNPNYWDLKRQEYHELVNAYEKQHPNK